MENRATGLNWLNRVQRIAVLMLWRAFSALFLAGCIPSIANAQVATSYNDTPAVAVAIPDNGCAATGTSVVRTINVPTSYIISDVNIGVLVNHPYRGDLRITLTHGATSVSLINGSGGATANLNVTFDDEATGGTIGSHTANDPLTPVYNSTKIPAAGLNAFDGQNATGAWTLTICDQANADIGTYVSASLTVTSAPTSYADLSLTNTVSNATPASGGTTDITLTVTNSATSPTAAAGVTVTGMIPAGTTFNSVVSGTGTYNSATGIWAVGAVPVGASRNIVIRVNVTATASATLTSIAEVSASSVVDLDSSPNNGSTTEDDYAARSFTVAGARTAGTPPTLTCPAGSSVFDWDTTAPTWTAGSTSNSYNLTNVGNLSYTLANPGAWLNNATYGGLSPTRQSVLNGSFTGQNSLWMGVNLANLSQSASSTITLPTAVPAAQFTIFDVDFGAAQYADRVTVTGTFNGSAVTPPILTNNIANYVIGNTAYGDASSADTQPNGNVVVTFQNPVDTIIISYGNHSTAPSDPGQQWISLHDLTFCNPQATLSVTKMSSVLTDGVSASNPKSIPGATVRYCITVTNAGSGTAANINVSDPLPGNVTYVAGSMLSGANCAGAATAEDENNTGADETDPFGISIAGTTITGTATTLPASSSMVIVFNATVN